MPALVVAIQAIERMISVVKAIVIMLVLGAFLGLALAIAAKFFYVKVDERIEIVKMLLPGYDCGGCGYTGCAGFAEALCNRKTDNVNLCRPSKLEGKQAIVDYLNKTPDNEGNVVTIKL